MSHAENHQRKAPGLITRRRALGAAGVGAAVFALDPSWAFAATGARSDNGAAGFGPLVPDPGGLLDLPKGFHYRVISQEGTKLSTGKPVPGDHDGMAAFPLGGSFPYFGGLTVLVRNHELDDQEVKSKQDAGVTGATPYDRDEPGGTTGIIVGPDERELASYVTSSGTVRNCSGGPTPWGTWLTCEETIERNGDKPHGYVFEVPPLAPQTPITAQPIRDMGFFSHEAVGVDPATSIVYLTEDDFRGEIPDDPSDEVPLESRASFLYRYIPNDRSQRPGALQQGGKLQALGVNDNADIKNNADLAGQGQTFRVTWIPVDPLHAHEDAARKGALRFNRLEGADFKGGAFWFDDTAGGEDRLGQIFRYRPKTNTLELFYEGSKPANIQSPDNLVVAPFGDVWFCEDGEGADRVVGITRDGRHAYPFARNALNDSELAGCCFGPDGQTFFVNIQEPGFTFVIKGPFPEPNAAHRRQAAHAPPPPEFGPKVSEELAEAARKHGMSRREAAAFERLGVPLG